MIARFLWALALTLGLARAATADELRPGYLEFHQLAEHDWRLVWKAPMRGGIVAETQPILPEGCSPSGAPKREVAPPFVLTTIAVRCTGAVMGKRLGLTAMEASQTDVLVRVAPLGQRVQALRLTAREPVATIAGISGTLQVGWTYLVLGIEHIVFGYDHLLFVVALVLLLRRGWPIVQAATAFTSAHSLTLVGTTVGLFGLPQQPVEAAIALSIVFLAVEIVKRREGQPRFSERAPWVVALAFGLLHGFGFAGALKEIGLPDGEVPMALLAFNLGVEAGQLAIILAVTLLVAGLRRFSTSLEAPAIRMATYGIGAVSSMWLFERVLG